MLVEVLLSGYRNIVLTYSCNHAQVGQIVMVTVRGKKQWGMVWSANVESDLSKILEVQEITSYIISPDYIQYMKKVAEYNIISHSEVLMMMLADIEENQNSFYYTHDGIVHSASALIGILGKRKFNKLLKENAIQSADFHFAADISLNESQLDAYAKMRELGFAKPILIKGKTGSGKTNLYFKAIEEMLSENAQILILMPEIALTKSFADRFMRQFNVMPHIWNSQVSDSAKSMIWKWSMSGSAGIVIGSRSALWLPFSNLKCIIVDEEHDPSYKQENAPRYNARDMSVLRAKYEKCAVILVSATPSLESWFNVQNGKYNIVDLQGDQPIQAKIIHRKPDEWITAELVKEINSELKSGKQCMLFLNRKGIARGVFCGVCSEYLMCPHCSANVVLYKNFVVACSYCGKRNYMKNCTGCGNMSWNTFGIGVEKIEEEVMSMFPEARIGAFTGDIKQLSKSIDAIHSGEINLIISTQILAKGHNFMNLSLVAILQGEQGLNSSNARNTERIYQLLTQVRGRCGRDQNLQSKVFIQSAPKQSGFLQNILDNDYDSWAKHELEFRQKAHLPPFYRIIRIVISNQNMSQAENDAKLLCEKIRGAVKNIDIFGPVPNQIHKHRSKFNYSLIIRYVRNRYPQKDLAAALTSVKLRNGSRFVVDVDPESLG